MTLFGSSCRSISQQTSLPSSSHLYSPSTDPQLIIQSCYHLHAILSVVQPMTHGWEKRCTTHGSWVKKVLYNPWVMGEKSVVQPMTHGREKCCTTHGSWVKKALYNPWVMGEKSVVQPMGHGWEKCCTTHGSWVRKALYNPWAMDGKSVVQPMGHG